MAAKGITVLGLGNARVARALLRRAGFSITLSYSCAPARARCAPELLADAYRCVGSQSIDRMHCCDIHSRRPSNIRSPTDYRRLCGGPPFLTLSLLPSFVRSSLPSACRLFFTFCVLEATVLRETVKTHILSLRTCIDVRSLRLTPV